MSVIRSNRLGIISCAIVLSLLAVAAVALPNLTQSVSAVAKPTVYVSLTWDDGRANQLQSVALQQAHSMPATYYINSSFIGSSPYYLTKSQLDIVAAGAGNEIGGHTVGHENLTKIPLADVQTAVCADRTRLISWYGEAAGRSFAYPYGANNSDVAQIVKSCGYSSGRTVTGVTSTIACQSCLPAESLPPIDPFRLVVPTSVSSSTTLADLQFQVDHASANGGGWVMYTLHDIGVDGSRWNIDTALYAEFLNWLAARPDVEVRTVGDLISQTWPTTTNTNTSPQTAPILTPIAMRNPDLEADGNGNGISDCWLRGVSGTNTALWSRVPEAHSGNAAEQVTITAYTSGDRKIVPMLDNGTANGGCAPSVDDQHAYKLSGWYRSTAPVRFVAFIRNATGAWSYWRTGPYTPAAVSWSVATWDTPQVPTGTTAISFGLLISELGTLTVDDYTLASISPAAPAIVDPLILNSSMETDGNGDGVPDCWSRTGYGINNASFSRVADAHSGLWGERLVVSSITSGDRKLTPTFDNGQGNGGCAPTAVGNTRYTFGVWYRSNAVAQMVAYHRNSSGIWKWWFSASFAPSNVNWTLASKVTPPTPAGTTAVSFGMALTSVGTLITDDYSLAPSI